MSLSRYTEALQAFASGRRMTYCDIAGHVGVSLGSARRYVRTAHAAGWVAPAGRRRNQRDNRTAGEWRWTGPAAADSPLVEWTPIEADPLLTTKQAAARLRIAEGTLRKWQHRGPHRIEHVKVGRFIRYRKSVLDEFLRGA